MKNEKENNKKTSRVSLNFSNETIKKVKEYAKKQGIPDTSAYMILINRGLATEEFIENHPFYLDSLSKDVKYIILQEPLSEPGDSTINSDNN